MFTSHQNSYVEGLTPQHDDVQGLSEPVSPGKTDLQREDPEHDRAHGEGHVLPGVQRHVGGLTVLDANLGRGGVQLITLRRLDLRQLKPCLALC